MPDPIVNRRAFIKGTAAGAGMFAAGLAGCEPHERLDPDYTPAPPLGPDAQIYPEVPPDYDGPNVVLIRFGGGVRRQETIQTLEQTYCPFLIHELAAKHGTLFPNVVIHDDPKIETSHGQGTLYLLTGQYDRYEDVTGQFIGSRFEPKEPTLFEYLRRFYNVPPHQALLINGEDRIDEEFYTFSNHHNFGIDYRSTVLSLYRYKTYLLRQKLKDEQLPEKERSRLEKEYNKMASADHRRGDHTDESTELDAFWEKWSGHYGRTGLVNPRGDRLLTELSLWAMRELKPKLMMVNYNDPDYVHWGPASFYTRAISIIDDGIRQLWEQTQQIDEYRDNTYFVVVPDCGRDNSRCRSVPFQHHFNSLSAREIFAVVAGPNVRKGNGPIDKVFQQIAVTRGVGDLMGFTTHRADANSGSLAAEVLV